MSIKLGKYRASNGLVVEVLHVGDRSVFYRTHDGYEGMVSISHASGWSEYKEPRTITFFVNIYEYDEGIKTGVVWGTREEAINAKGFDNHVDTMEVTWTEKTDG